MEVTCGVGFPAGVVTIGAEEAGVDERGSVSSNAGSEFPTMVLLRAATARAFAAFAREAATLAVLRTWPPRRPRARMRSVFFKAGRSARFASPKNNSDSGAGPK